MKINELFKLALNLVDPDFRVYSVDVQVNQYLKDDWVQISVSLFRDGRCVIGRATVPDSRPGRLYGVEVALADAEASYEEAHDGA